MERAWLKCYFSWKLEDWTKFEPMIKYPETEIFEKIISLPRTKHYFKFIVDNKWVIKCII